MKTALILPIYNESKYIGNVIQEAKSYVDVVIAVDDGSQDASYEISKKAGALALHHTINLGKSAALKTGVTAALKLGIEIIIFMDSDGQHLPKDLPRFIEPIEKEGYDMIIGARKGGQKMPFLRKWGNKMLEWAAFFLFKCAFNDIQSGYRAFRANVYPQLDWKAESYYADAEMTIRAVKYHLKCKQIFIDTIYYDDFKGMTVVDGLNLLFQIFIWRFILGLEFNCYASVLPV
ncbi:MAG: glycosyltransferase family 2 protein [Candidatus Gracilibacteria bacterium]